MPPESEPGLTEECAICEKEHNQSKMFECAGRCARDGLLVCRACFGNKGQGNPCARCDQNACCTRCAGYESVRYWCEAGSNGACVGYEKGMCSDCCCAAPCCELIFCLDCQAAFSECNDCGDARCRECLPRCCGHGSLGEEAGRRLSEIRKKMEAEAEWEARWEPVEAACSAGTAGRGACGGVEGAD